MNKAKRLLITIILISITLVGTVGCSVNPPSQKQVLADAENIVNKMGLRKTFGSGEKKPGKYIYFEGIEFKETAVASDKTEAHVQTIVKVRYEYPNEPKGKKHYNRHGIVYGGFENWFPDVVTNGATMRFKVTFVYRRYDVGWRLEKVK